MLTRRRFLGGLTALVGGVVLEEAIPFNRVWSFPKEIVPLNLPPLTTIYYNPDALYNLKYAFVSAKVSKYEDYVTMSDLPSETQIFSATGMEASLIRSFIRKGWMNGEMRAFIIE